MKTMIVITNIIEKNKNGFTAYCPEFDICTQGKTIEESDNNLKEAVLLYLETIEELGIRDKIFKEKKIKLHRSSKKIKKEVPIELTNKKNSPFVTTKAIPCC